MMLLKQCVVLKTGAVSPLCGAEFVFEVRNGWGGIGGKKTKPVFLICEEYSVIFAVQRDQPGAGDGSHSERAVGWPRGASSTPTQEVFGVSWVALRLGVYSPQTLFL